MVHDMNHGWGFKNQCLQKRDEQTAKREERE